MITVSVPDYTSASMHDFIPGIKDSHPSSPNLFIVLNFSYKKLENPSAHKSLSKRCNLSSFVISLN
jgi:hypothetical protein